MKFNRISSEAEQAVRSAASAAAAVAEDVAGDVKARAEEQFDRMESAIHRNPMAAVAAAAGVGLILALIARR